MDVLGATAVGIEIKWWENADGSATSWIEHPVEWDFSGTPHVCSEDLDGDGNLDVIGATSYVISWWDLTSYGGYLESSILQKNPMMQAKWVDFSWNCYEPDSTEVYFQYRHSSNPQEMGMWSDLEFEPFHINWPQGDRFFQYRVFMETETPDSLPALYDVTLTWDLTGVEGDPSVTQYVLFGAEPNPTHGSANITFAVPELSVVGLSVYDLSGHLVLALAHKEYSQGKHHVQLEELAPGVYFCRMISGDFTDTQRFVVIE
jgi:hypothetical protein